MIPSTAVELFVDDELGTFSGNIIEALSVQMPSTMATELMKNNPVVATWRLVLRRLNMGATGYFFFVADGVVPAVRPMLQELFRGFPHDSRYPDLFNEAYAADAPMVCLSDGRISVWHMPACTEDVHGV